MKQLLFMIPSLLIGTIGSFYTHPYLGVLVYYLYAVLRPQFIWEWSLPVVAWSYYVAIAAMAATLLWRMGIVSFYGENVKCENNIVHYSLYSFSIWIVITFFTAVNSDVAFVYLVEYAKIFIMFIVARYAICQLRQVWCIFVVVTVSLCYISYEVNEIYFSTGYTYVFKKGYGGMDNNGAALMLAMGVPLCLYTWDGIKHWIRWGFVLFIPIIVHAVLTSYSRGAMVSLLLTIPIYLIRSRRRSQLIVILLSVFATIPFLAGNEIRERFFTLEQNDIDESANSRRNSWAIAQRMANEKPIFGFGIRNSNLFTYAYGADMEGRTIHSQWLQIAADSGYPALILYISTFISMFYCCFKIRQVLRHRDDLQARQAIIIANGCEGSLLVFCIGATFLSLETFELPYILLLLSGQLWAVCKATNSLDSVFMKNEKYSDNHIFATQDRHNG